MKKMMKYIVSLVIIIILWGCRYDKPIMPISNLDIIRVQIVGIDEGEYYYVEPSRSYKQRMDFVIFNVEIMELYNDLVGAESELEYQKGDIVKMAIPLNNKEVILSFWFIFQILKKYMIMQKNIHIKCSSWNIYRLCY